ncbi:MAG TPA: hypothetical protein VNA25_08730 [Phycisphaerae bacterium]|nr:hypothetical protein [Phycisphaerae bacterium]
MPPPTANSRKVLLTSLMIGILLVTVAVAWWLTRFRNAAMREGAHLVDEMRRRSLSDIWPRGALQAVFVRRDGAGRETGRVTVERVATDGGFAGRVRDEPLPAFRGRLRNVREDWSIRGDLSAGQYQAAYVGENRIIGIILAGEDVHVTVNGQPIDSVPIPANYLPEGLMWLAVRMVADRGREATFAFVSNEESEATGTVALNRVTMTPVGAREVRCTVATGRGRYDVTYHLDASGEVSSVRWEEGMTLTRVEMEQPQEAPPQTLPATPARPDGD